MSDTDLTHVFVFSARRADVARWYEEVVGLTRDSEAHDDSVWYRNGGAQFVVHDREDEPADAGIVPWFHVQDLNASYERALRDGSAIGSLRTGHFFARDPEGHVVGVRQRRPRSATGRT